MFVGRQYELKRLETLYESTSFECVTLQGGRRVGKTALLREFAKSKEIIYYSAAEVCSYENLHNFSECVSMALGGAPKQEPQSFSEVFTRLRDTALARRLALIIDDYHLLAASQRDISDTICEQITSWGKDSSLMLLISGSYEQEKGSDKQAHRDPIMSIRTANIQLKPFTFFEQKRLYPGFSLYDVAVVYGVTGGVPGYLQYMDPQAPIEENISKAFFDAAAPLLEEPHNILRREVRDPAYYNSVLRAIATGKKKNSEIAEAVGLETSACTAYLRNLMELGLVEKHTPVTEKAGKKTIYSVCSNMFRFWYKFVPGEMSLIMSGQSAKLWRRVADEIHAYMSGVFEDICREWLAQQNQAGRLPARFVEIGRWWGLDPIIKQESMLPMLAYADDEHAAFGDCVWSDEPAQAEALVSLDERSRFFRYANRYLYLFSRSGFSQECAEVAKRIGANLVMFE